MSCHSRGQEIGGYPPHQPFSESSPCARSLVALQSQRQRIPDSELLAPWPTWENNRECVCNCDCTHLDQEPGGKGLLSPDLHLTVYKMGTVTLTSTELWKLRGAVEQCRVSAGSADVTGGVPQLLECVSSGHGALGSCLSSAQTGSVGPRL